MEGQTKYLVPSTLGVGLVEGYNEIGFDKSLSKPQLRREVRSNPYNFRLLLIIGIRLRGAWLKSAKGPRLRNKC